MDLIYVLYKQWKIHQEFRHIYNPLQVEVVLAAEQRIVAFVLERHTVHLISVAVGLRLLQTLSVNRAEKSKNFLAVL